MPVVRAERQIRRDALPGVRKTAAETFESEGGGLAIARGDAAAAVAGAVRRNIGEPATQIGIALFTKMQDDERKAADETALLKAQNQLSEWTNQTLYDPNNGAFAKKGQDALPLPEQVREGFTQKASEIGAALSTPEQRSGWARMQEREWESIDLQVRRHVFGEMQSYRAGELKAAVANSTDAAIRSAQDPLLVGEHLAKAVTAIHAVGPSLGLGKEAIEEQVRATQTGVHIGVINQLLALDQDKNAAEYFAHVKDQIAGDRLDQVQKAIEAGNLRGESQRTADKIIAAGGTLSEQLEKAKGLEPKLRDEVQQRIEHAQALKDRADKEAEDQQIRGAFDVVEKTGDVNKIPPAIWSTFGGGTRAALRNYAEHLVKGEPVQTDLPTYYSLMQQAADDPAAFVGQNLLNYRAKLGEAEFKQLTALQLSVKKQDGNPDPQLAGFSTKKEIVDSTLTTYGINPNAKPDSAEGKAIAQLRRMLDRRVDAAQVDGKKVSNAEIQQSLDDLLSQNITVPGSWWNIFPGGRPFFDQQKRLLDTTIDDVPNDARDAIKAALRDAGRPVSDATVLDTYLEMQIRRQRQQGKK